MNAKPKSSLPIAMGNQTFKTGGQGIISTEFLSASAFRIPARLDGHSAWIEHLPFAFWIVEALRPRLLVELGTHSGTSYCGFCEGIRHLHLETRCFAVDTWKGDAHAGFYGEEIFRELSRYHDESYSAFSRLVRATFDEAAGRFEDGTIDLLHIDGQHFYEDVKHDFETWAPKLSPRAVVLMHDTNVRERGFGVHRFWSELAARHPSFEFLHGHGLGVLGFGNEIPTAVKQLFTAAESPALRTSIRECYARLGNNLTARIGQERSAAQLRSEIECHAARLADMRLTISRGKADCDASRREQDALRRELEARGRVLEEIHQHLLRSQAEVRELRRSFSWQITGPLRWYGRFLQRLGRSIRKRRRTLGRIIFRTGEPENIATHTPDAEPAKPPPPATAGTGRRVVFICGEPETPGASYRVDMYMRALSQRGYETSRMDFPAAFANPVSLDDADAVVIWRAPWTDQLAEPVLRARDRGARVIFDVDDLLFDPAMARVSLIDGIRSQGFTEESAAEAYAKFQRTMMEADYCTCTTRTLAGQMRRFGKPAFVLPNGFDEERYTRSRQAVSARRAAGGDGLVRIGYATGSRTHQKDFARASGVVARILREHPECRLVLFHWDIPGGTIPCLDAFEFPELDGVWSQIEWRQYVPLGELARELARFDINLAPLETGNAFCEAKSELKYFEAALVDVPTVASPTQPYAGAISDGHTGFLANDEGAWYAALKRLVADAGLRRRVGRAAFLDVLWRFGPEARAEAAGNVFEQIMTGGATAAHSFELELHRAAAPRPPAPEMAAHDVIFETGSAADAEVAVVVPLHNYAGLIAETLESVKSQTFRAKSLVIVDDASTDDSPRIAREWLGANHAHFTHTALLRNKANSGLPLTRNNGFLHAEARFVFTLDADNLILPGCLERFHDAILKTGAPAVFGPVQEFDGGEGMRSATPWQPGRFVGGNYVDAMALIRRSAWAAVGGYLGAMVYGWEDYEFWCRFIEHGFWAAWVPDVLTRYRVHGNSLLNKVTDTPANRANIIRQLQALHPWLDIAASADEDDPAPLPQIPMHPATRGNMPAMRERNSLAMVPA